MQTGKNITVDDIKNSYCALLINKFNNAHEYHVIPEKMIYYVNNLKNFKPMKPRPFSSYDHNYDEAVLHVDWLLNFTNPESQWALTLLKTKEEFEQHYFINKL